VPNTPRPRIPTHSSLPLLLALVTAISLAAPPSPAGAAGATVTSVTMYSEAGDYIGQGQHRLFHPGNGTVSASGDADYLSVHVSGGWLDDSYMLTFAPPPGQLIHAGLYEGAQRAAFREAGRPGIDVGGDGRGCNEIEGRFDVKDVAFSGDGSVERLWLTFEQHCEGGLPALFGEVRYRSPASGSDPVVAASHVWWPDLDLGYPGTTIPVTVEALAKGLTISRVAVVGRHPEDFQIRVDECSGAVLSPGALCKVFLRFTAQNPGPRMARLLISSSAGRSRVQLDGFGVGGRTRFVMHSETGDYIGQGRDYAYAPGNATMDVDGDRALVSGWVTGADGNWWSARFKPAPGDIFVAGTTYTGARRFAFSGTAPGMDVSGSGRGCNTIEGQFTVTHIAVNADESLRSVGVDFEQHCEGGDPALFGTLEFRVPTGDTTPPGKISGLRVTRAGGRADLSWTNPPDSDLAFVVVRWLQAETSPGSPNAGHFGYAGKKPTASLRGLDASLLLAVSVFSVDRSGNPSQPVVAVASPA
jgi:hypothetical protein